MRHITGEVTPGWGGRFLYERSWTAFTIYLKMLIPYVYVGLVLIYFCRENLMVRGGGISNRQEGYYVGPEVGRPNFPPRCRGSVPQPIPLTFSLSSIKDSRQELFPMKSSHIRDIKNLWGYTAHLHFYYCFCARRALNKDINHCPPGGGSSEVKKSSSPRCFKPERRCDTGVLARYPLSGVFRS